jgi:predicted ArsR family transcriptional regulator
MAPPETLDYLVVHELSHLREMNHSKRFWAIVAEHCPFGEAAKKYPHVVCAVDRGMIRGMLAGLYGETRPHHTESLPAGDDHCVARV